MNNVRRITQAYSQAPWRRQVAMIGAFLLGVVVVALIAGIYLDVTARAATLGREILDMQDKIGDLRFQIADEEIEVARLTSVEIMRQRALDLGFIPMEIGDADYVVVPGYVAQQTVQIAPPPTQVRAVAADLPPIYTESLFDWLRRTFDSQRNRVKEVQP